MVVNHLPPLLARARPSARAAARALAIARGGAAGLGEWPESMKRAHHAAVGLWAFSSTISAGRANLDMVGCLIAAFFATLGGSTIRDLVLGRRVFWVRDGSYLATLGAVSVATFLVWPVLEEIGVKQIWFELPDAIGLAFYSVYGSQLALSDAVERELHLSPLVGVLMGLASSCFGGVMGDLVCGIPVRMLKEGHTLYAVPALLASASYTAWRVLAPDTADDVGAFVSFFAALSLRMAAVKWDWCMPSWLNKSPATRGWFWRPPTVLDPRKHMKFAPPEHENGA